MGAGGLFSWNTEYKAVLQDMFAISQKSNFNWLDSLSQLFEALINILKETRNLSKIRIFDFEEKR